MSTLNDTVLESFEVIRKDIPSGGGIGDIIGLLQDNILYVDAGLAVILILSIVICKRR